MTAETQEDTTIYRVVVNHEEQYSIWPAERDLPLGWREAGKNGSKQECLAYIEEVWTDMRPLSLRKQMEEMAKNPPPLPEAANDEQPTRTGDELVDRLSEGDQPVEASLHPDQTAQRLKERIEQGYVHIKFTQTQGGTELGVRLLPDLCDSSQANFDNATGSVHLVGELVLNYVKVRCIADIDLATLAGQGHLETVDA